MWLNLFWKISNNTLLFFWMNKPKKNESITQTTPEWERKKNTQRKKHKRHNIKILRDLRMQMCAAFSDMCLKALRSVQRRDHLKSKVIWPRFFFLSLPPLAGSLLAASAATSSLNSSISLILVASLANPLKRATISTRESWKPGLNSEIH